MKYAFLFTFLISSASIRLYAKNQEWVYSPMAPTVSTICLFEVCDLKKENIQALKLEALSFLSSGEKSAAVNAAIAKLKASELQLQSQTDEAIVGRLIGDLNKILLEK